MVTQHNPQAADALLALDDDAVLAFDEERASDLELRALDRDFLAIRIRGPERLDLQTRDELPLLLLSRTTGLRDWQVTPQRNAVLVSVDQSTGTVRTAWAFPTHKRINVERMQRSLREGDLPEPEDADSVMVTAQRLAVRQALDLPWTAGEHCLTLIRYDWPSNTVRVRLEAQPVKPVAPYPLEDARRLASGTDASRAGFERDGQTPELEGAGAMLRVPDSARAEDSRFVVRGALRLPAPAGCIVARGDAEDSRLPAVVLRAALLLVKRDELSPVRAELEVPVFSEAAVAPGDEVDGCFAVDLYALGLRQQLLEGDTQLYLVAGSHVAGPYPVRAQP